MAYIKGDGTATGSSSAPWQGPVYVPPTTGTTSPPPGGGTGTGVGFVPGAPPVSVNVVSQPSYSTDQRDQYRVVRQWAKDAYQFSSVADVDGRTKQAAEMWKSINGRWPSATELWEYTLYQNSLGLLASGGAYMEPIFGIIPDGGGATQWVKNSGFSWSFDDEEALYYERLGDRFKGAGVSFPKYTVDQLGEILGSLSPISGGVGGSGGRGGGGGAGRAALAFDRNQLAEEATNRWRGLLLEEPDETTLSSLVGDYISEANAFWMKEAGRLDYDTFVVDRVRREDRYNYLYDKKPEFQSEAEYMGGFRQTVGQFGFNDRAALRETEAGAHSGAGLSGFGERVGRTGEARLANAGSYSQRFAASMQQSGLGNT